MTFDRLDLALKESVGNLHGDHRRVLHWYAHHVGEEHDYHDLQLQDGIPLIFPYKHICRLSKKGEYAVSVRTGGNLVYQPDDSWSLTFHHSDQNGVQRVAKCLNDSIPIGVLWQSTYQYPGSRIREVLGLAMVVERGERYFTFRGLPDGVGKGSLCDERVIARKRNAVRRANDLHPQRKLTRCCSKSRRRTRFSQTTQLCGSGQSCYSNHCRKTRPTRFSDKIVGGIPRKMCDFFL